MVNYQNGKIYMIITENSNDIYVGSTVQTLKRRLEQHECKYRKGVYRSSQEILKQGNYKIVLIKNYACNSKLELETEEAKYQRDLVCVNKYRARITEEERRELKELKEMRNEEQRQRKEMSRTDLETIKKKRLRDKLYKRKYRQRKKKEKIKCVCGGYYTFYHKQQHEETKKHLNYLRQQKQ